MFLWPVFRRVQNLRDLQILCSRDRRCWAANTSRKSDPLRFPLPSGPRSYSLTPERLCRTTQGPTHHFGPALLSGKNCFIFHWNLLAGFVRRRRAGIYKAVYIIYWRLVISAAYKKIKSSKGCWTYFYFYLLMLEWQKNCQKGSKIIH